MIHTCNVHCHEIDPTEADLLGLTEKGKWLPFAIDISIVVSIKMTTDEKNELTYQCTTLFTETGDSFIIDTKYVEFLKIWLSFNEGKEPSSDNDLEIDF